MPTLIIDNFGGRLTRNNYGDINSGFAKILQTFGNDPFADPKTLNWMEQATQIDPTYSVLTDLIVGGKERVESGIVYVYAIGHTGRVYKIQVNDPSSYNPNYDNPVLLTTLTAGSPTFTRGGYIDFFGSTERIYIGHDKGVTRLNFDGTGETAISGTWVQTVPRPLKQFIGKMYIGNGTNIAEIDSTGTVTSSAKLSPGFPDNTQVRDMDISTDGNYLHMVVTRLALSDITSIVPDSSSIANLESYIFKWNGTDINYTSFDTYPSFSLTSNIIAGNYQYVFGSNLVGASLFNPTEMILALTFEQPPLPNAVGFNANFVGWMTTFSFGGFLEVCQTLYGSLDQESGVGQWSQFGQLATGTETDVVRVPYQQLVSNLSFGTSSNGYIAGAYGLGKTYFSTLETSAAPTTKYKFYKWSIVPLGLGAAIDGVYETQTELFSKKVTIKELRIYSKPWIAANSFQIDLIGSNGNPMTNGTKVFTAGSTLTIGNDFAWWNPQMNNTYALGLRISNLGVTNHTINKVEIDYEPAGR